MRRAAILLSAIAAAMVLPSAAVAAPVTTADLDCADFSTQAAAQSYYVSLGGPAVDPDRLDSDNDGIACESLPCPCSSGSPAPPAVPVTPALPQPTAALPQPTATPPCGSGDPLGLEFVGLRSRLRIGEREIFSVDYSADAFVSGLASFQMIGEDGEVFAQGELDPILDDAWLLLEIGDRWVTIVASATEEHLDGSECVRTISQRVDAVERLYMPSRCFTPTYRPKSMILACGDADFQLRRISWQNWSSAVAGGRAVALVNDCLPSCAGGRFHRLRVTVRASSRKHCPKIGRYVYTRLDYRMRGRLPKGVGPRSGRVVFPCRLYG